MAVVEGASLPADSFPVRPAPQLAWGQMAPSGTIGIERPLLASAVPSGQPAKAVQKPAWPAMAVAAAAAAALMGLGLVATTLATILAAPRRELPLPPDAGAGEVVNATRTIGSKVGITSASVLSTAMETLPWLRITGGPPPPPRQKQWVARICTRLFPGPNCSTPTNWSGIVTLHLNGLTMYGVRLRTRGHVSRLLAKNQYLIKLPHATNILGMSPARKWILGSSWVDTSFQRNPLAFEIYRSLGGWATQIRYVNLDFGGKDMGLFYIGEKIEKGSGRLQVPMAVPMKPEASGFLLTIDWPKSGRRHIISRATATEFTVLYPAKREVTQQQMVYLKWLLDEVDTRAAAPVPTNTSEADALEEVLDYTSFARFFITEEVAKDVDGYLFSTFILVRHGKLYHAAPWDFDLAFGYLCDQRFWALGTRVAGWASAWNVEIPRETTVMQDELGFPGRRVIRFGRNKKQIFLNIWRRPRFRAAFDKMWQTSRRPDGPLSDAALMASLEHRHDHVATAALRDLHIWRNAQRCGVFQCCSPAASQDFELASRLLSAFVAQRVRWMDAQVGIG